MPGDIGLVTHLHGYWYHAEQHYSIAFEAYVARGLVDFYTHFNPAKERTWLCEHDGKLVGFMALAHREERAQLRYFIIVPGYRGIGLGKKLMDLFMGALHDLGYRSAFLLTVSSLKTAASLYKHYGFRLESETQSDAFGKPVTEQTYVLELLA